MLCLCLKHLLEFAQSRQRCNLPKHLRRYLLPDRNTVLQSRNLLKSPYHWLLKAARIDLLHLSP